MGDELRGVGGRYLEDCNEGLPWDAASPFTGYMDYAVDPDGATRLWEISERFVATTS